MQPILLQILSFCSLLVQQNPDWTILIYLVLQGFRRDAAVFAADLPFVPLLPQNAFHFPNAAAQNWAKGNHPRSACVSNYQEHLRTTVARLGIPWARVGRNGGAGQGHMDLGSLEVSRA
jgi:hypothetical protein